MVLGRRNRPSQSQTELDFIDCVSRNMGGGSDGVAVIGEQEFMDAMFPWFEPRTAPLNTNELPKLLREPILAERMRDIGLKYLVWVEGNTRRTSQTGSMSCTATPGGAGCFGFLTWEKRFLLRGIGVERAYGPSGRPCEFRCSRYQLHPGPRGTDPDHCARAGFRLQQPCQAAQGVCPGSQLSATFGGVFR